MRKLTDNQYQEFNPDERFRLTLSALVREDMAEAERLMETCPWRSYEARDMRYIEKMNGAKSIMALFVIECSHLSNLIMRIESFLGDFLTDAEEDKNNWYQKRMDVISKLKGLYRGLSAFCYEEGLNSDELLACIPIGYACPGMEQYLQADVDASIEYATKIKDMFIKCWSVQ